MGRHRGLKRWGPMVLDEDDLDLTHEDSNRGQELRAAIDLGLRVQEFNDSQLGQRLIRDSEAERLSLMEDLVKCDEGDDARKIRQRIGVLDHWQNLFAAYIEAGKKAEVEFQEE